MKSTKVTKGVQDCQGCRAGGRAGERGGKLAVTTARCSQPHDGQSVKQQRVACAQRRQHGRTVLYRTSWRDGVRERGDGTGERMCGQAGRGRFAGTGGCGGVGKVVGIYGGCRIWWCGSGVGTGRREAVLQGRGVSNGQDLLRAVGLVDFGACEWPRTKAIVRERVGGGGWCCMICTCAADAQGGDATVASGGSTSRWRKCGWDVQGVIIIIIIIICNIELRMRIAGIDLKGIF